MIEPPAGEFIYQRGAILHLKIYLVNIDTSPGVTTTLARKV